MSQIASAGWELGLALEGETAARYLFGIAQQADATAIRQVLRTKLVLRNEVPELKALLR